MVKSQKEEHLSSFLNNGHEKKNLSIMNYSSMLMMTKYFVFFHLVLFIIASKQPQTLEALCSEIVAQQHLSDFRCSNFICALLNLAKLSVMAEQLRQAQQTGSSIPYHFLSVIFPSQAQFNESSMWTSWRSK